MGDKNLNISYFRSLVKKETQSLNSLCKLWKVIKEENEILEEFIGEIDVASGQSDLLIQERFSQFNGLIDNCEFKTGEKEVTMQDLDGFWHIIYFQILGIKSKFEKLEELRNNNWVSPTITKKPIIQKKTKVINTVKPKQFAAKSSIRDHILAARKKLKTQQSTGNEGLNSEDLSTTEAKENSETNSPPKASFQALEDSKQFDAGFFKVETPVKRRPTSKLKTSKNNFLGTPKLLSSTGLKSRLQKSPMVRKDYSPCMRITRSAKRIALSNLTPNWDQEGKLSPSKHL